MSSVTIDGQLYEEAWLEAEWSDIFVDIEGGPIKGPIPQNTRMKMCYDNQYLYVAFEILEEHIWAYLTKKNKPVYQYDSDIEAFIDPNGDSHNYYELELNAINTIWELSLDKPYRISGSPRDPDNMVGMNSAVHIRGTVNDPRDVDTSWTVEIAFPWEGFKKYDAPALPPRAQDIWRINFSRVQWDTKIDGNQYEKIPDRREHNWVWSPQHQINMHAPEFWGYLLFDEGKGCRKVSERDHQVRLKMLELLDGNKRGAIKRLKRFEWQKLIDKDFEHIVQKHHGGYVFSIKTKGKIFTITDQGKYWVE